MPAYHGETCEKWTVISLVITVDYKINRNLFNFVDAVVRYLVSRCSHQVTFIIRVNKSFRENAFDILYAYVSASAIFLLIPGAKTEKYEIYNDNSISNAE